MVSVVVELSKYGLDVFERKIVRKIFSSVRVDDDNRIQINKELYELPEDMDFVQRIIIQRLRLLTHIVWMEENVLGIQELADTGEENEHVYIGRF